MWKTFAGLSIAVALLANVAVTMAQEAPGQGRADASSADGKTLMQEAAKKVHSYSGLDTEFRFKTHSFGHTLVGTGKYLQHRPAGGRADRLFFLELKTQLEDYPVAFQTICGRQFLWIRRDFGPEDQSLARVTLLRLRKAIEQAGPPLSNDATPTWLAIASLPKLLGVIGEWYDFEAPEQTTYSPAKLPVIRLRGRMNAEMKEEFLGSKAGVGQGGEQIPDAVEILLADGGEVPLFPYRLEFQRSSLQSGGEFRASMLMLEFHQVKVRTDLDPRMFEYSPGDQEVEDRTKLFLTRLGFPEP